MANDSSRELKFQYDAGDRGRCNPAFADKIVDIDW